MSARFRWAWTTWGSATREYVPGGRGRRGAEPDADDATKVSLSFLKAHERVSQVGVDDVEQRATLLLAQLASNNVNRPKIIFHGGFKPLMYNAQYGSPDLRRTSQV